MGSVVAAESGEGFIQMTSGYVGRGWFTVSMSATESELRGEQTGRGYAEQSRAK